MGVGEAKEFFSCLMEGMGWRWKTSWFQRIWPVLASMQRARREVGMLASRRAGVREILPLERTGEGGPRPGISMDQAMFSLGDHLMGRLVEVEMPWPVGSAH